MFLTQSLNKLLICGLVTVLSQDAQKSLSFVQSLGGFMKTTGKSVMNESRLEVHATSEVISGGYADCGGNSLSNGFHWLISFNVRHVGSIKFNFLHKMSKSSNIA